MDEPRTGLCTRPVSIGSSLCMLQGNLLFVDAVDQSRRTVRGGRGPQSLPLMADG